MNAIVGMIERAHANGMRNVIAIIVVAISCAVVSSAQNPVRIRFAKGATSTILRGSTGNTGVLYVLRAKAGQKLILTLWPPSKAGIKVETIGRYGRTVLLREERGGTYQIGLEETGDYTIFVGSTIDRPGML